MNTWQPAKGKLKQVVPKITHPLIGELYCRNEMETRATLNDIFVEQLYLQHGISIFPGYTVCDVGAYIGIFTLYAALQGAQVYAFEPIPATFELLQANIFLHGLNGTAWARNVGLSDAVEEKMLLHYPTWLSPTSRLKLMTGRWEPVLEKLKVSSFRPISSYSQPASRASQRGAVRELIKTSLPSTLRIKCKFNTLSDIIVYLKIGKLYEAFLAKLHTDT